MDKNAKKKGRKGVVILVIVVLLLAIAFIFIKMQSNDAEQNGGDAGANEQTSGLSTDDEVFDEIDNNLNYID